jgi:hypothetical protein
MADSVFGTDLSHLDSEAICTYDIISIESLLVLLKSLNQFIMSRLNSCSTVNSVSNKSSLSTENNPEIFPYKKHSTLSISSIPDSHRDLNSTYTKKISKQTNSILIKEDDDQNIEFDFEPATHLNETFTVTSCSISPSSSSSSSTDEDLMKSVKLKTETFSDRNISKKQVTFDDKDEIDQKLVVFIIITFRISI